VVQLRGSACEGRSLGDEAGDAGIRHGDQHGDQASIRW
jgi:hypothetical protein